MKSLLVGSLVVFGISFTSMMLMEILKAPIFGFVMWGAVIIGSIVTATIEEKRKIIFALMLAIPASIIMGINNMLWEVSGKATDFPGAHGFLLVIALSIPTSAVLCGIGGGIGWLLTHNKANPADARSARDG